MTFGPEGLLKILKDETRRKIVILLAEKNNLSYTDLMNAIKISSTGTLNYHLKVLNDLLTKNQTGQYLLTEKGKLAARLLIEFPESENKLQERKKWWKRFWVISIILQFAGLSFILVLYFLGRMDNLWLFRGLLSFGFGMIFIYFFYRMIRLTTGKQQFQIDTFRTIKDIFVSGRNLQEVRQEVIQWINEEKIVMEFNHEDFIRGSLGAPSRLGLTSPKYFEISLKSDPKGVKVHTEGWIGVFNSNEMCFSKSILAMGGLPRRKGYKIIEKLWNRLENISK